MQSTSTKTTTIRKKLLNILADMPAIEKKGFNEKQRYAYMRDEDILEALRPLLIKHGVLPTFWETELKVEERVNPSTGSVVRFNILKGVLHFFCVDSEEFISIPCFGTSADAGDKGKAKATTAAIKQAYMKQFLISDDDDLEKTENDDISKTHSAPKQWSNTGVYLVDFGKHKGLTLDQLGVQEVNQTLTWINGLQSPAASLLKFRDAATVWLQKKTQTNKVTPPFNDNLEWMENHGETLV